jgi:hypothetical protein
MKWYKHTCDSLDDPIIFDLMEEFGLAGYVFFFGFLELYGKEYEHILSKIQPKYTVKLSFLHQKLKISVQIIKKLLPKIEGWEISFEGDKVSVFIPKFHQLADEWSSRKLGSLSGVSRETLGNRSRSRLEEEKKEKDSFSYPEKDNINIKEMLKNFPKRV